MSKLMGMMPGMGQMKKAMAGANLDEKLLFMFDLLLLGDVAGDLGGADDPALLVVDRRNGQCHFDEAPVFALADRLVVRDALSPPRSCVHELFAAQAGLAVLHRLHRRDDAAVARQHPDRHLPLPTRHPR